MRKILVIDTAKINNETLKMINEFKISLDKATDYLKKINEIKNPEMISELEYINKCLNSHKNICDCYTKHLNKSIKSFNEFTSNTIKNTMSIEKVNAHVLISKR